MKFKWDVMGRTAAGGFAVALVASCGGGTQIDAFVPGRVIAFGDESSYVSPTGTKYTVNSVEFDTTVTPNVPKQPTVLLCTANQVWTQQLGYNYGLGYAGCPGGLTSPNGEMRASATAGGKVADLSAQVTSFLATNAFRSNDLVTVMAGVNDIIDAAMNAADPVAAVEAAGTQVGAEVVRITDRGAKVLVSTVPDVGFTPYAITLEQTVPGTVARLSGLTTRFNTKLRLKLQDVADGGRAVGLVLADELVLSMVRFPLSYGLNNTTQAACPPAPALPDCNVTALVTAAQATYAGDWLWADDRHLGANAQSRLGSLAINRARNNPF